MCGLCNPACDARRGLGGGLASLMEGRLGLRRGGDSNQARPGVGAAVT